MESLNGRDKNKDIPEKFGLKLRKKKLQEPKPKFLLFIETKNIFN